jgi:hypothetical protein
MKKIKYVSALAVAILMAAMLMFGMNLLFPWENNGNAIIR